jgi:hypothetical protein
MSSVTLNKIVAVEKGAKERFNRRISDLYKQVQKPALFQGMDRTYQPATDDGQQLPPERQLIEARVDVVLEDLAEIVANFYDVIATKDHGNTIAKADVVVDGKVLVKDASVPFLLFLEKELVSLRSFIKELPILSVSEEWTWNDDATVFVATPVQTHKTKKVLKAVTLYEATPEHPAQVEKFTEDEIVGFWTAIKSSAAVTAKRRSELEARVNVVLEAVKQAREEANMTEVPQQHVGAAIFKAIFA